MAQTPEEMLRHLMDLVKTGDQGDMYRNWGADQDKLRQMKLTGSPLYAEPYDRSANVTDRENTELLRRIFELFGQMGAVRDDGIKAVLDQQNAGNDVADVTQPGRDKYRTPFQEQFSGQGFEAALGSLLRGAVEQQAQTLALKVLAMVEDERRKKDEEDEHRKKDEEDKRKKDEEDARRKKEDEDKRKKDEEAALAANVALTAKLDEMQAKLSAMEQQLAQAQAAASPFGSRVGQSVAVGGATAPGVLQPTTSQTAQAAMQQIQSFTLEGQKVLGSVMSTDPSRAERVRQDIFEASLQWKSGGRPTISDPELREIATRLGLPHGMTGSPAANEGGVG